MSKTVMIYELPILLRNLALQYQLEQGNIPSLNVELGEGKTLGNFFWCDTPEGDEFWCKIYMKYGGEF